MPECLFLIKLQAEAYNFIKKEALAQVFSCEFFIIFKTPFLTEHLHWMLLEILRDYIERYGLVYKHT